MNICGKTYRSRFLVCSDCVAKDLRHFSSEALPVDESATRKRKASIELSPSFFSCKEILNVFYQFIERIDFKRSREQAKQSGLTRKGNTIDPISRHVLNTPAILERAHCLLWLLDSQRKSNSFKVHRLLYLITSPLLPFTSSWHRNSKAWRDFSTFLFSWLLYKDSFLFQQLQRECSLYNWFFKGTFVISLEVWHYISFRVISRILKCILRSFDFFNFGVARIWLAPLMIIRTGGFIVWFPQVTSAINLMTVLNYFSILLSQVVSILWNELFNAQSPCMKKVSCIEAT